MSDVRQKAFNAFLRGITAVFVEHGFERTRSRFSRSDAGLVQTVVFRRALDIDDKFDVLTHLEIEYRSDDESFGRLIQFVDGSRNGTCVAEPFDSTAVEVAVGFNTRWLEDRVFPLADRLRTVEEARAYDWVFGAFRDDEVSLQTYVPG